MGLLWVIGTAHAQLAVPALSAHVIDTTGTLEATQRQLLDAKLSTFKLSRGAQVVILLVPTTQPEDITSYANRVANAWKIGRKEIGDGLLIVVAKNDRKVRIEVAKTLEGAIPVNGFRIERNSGGKGIRPEFVFARQGVLEGARRASANTPWRAAPVIWVS